MALNDEIIDGISFTAVSAAIFSKDTLVTSPKKISLPSITEFASHGSAALAARLWFPQRYLVSTHAYRFLGTLK